MTLPQDQDGLFGPAHVNDAVGRSDLPGDLKAVLFPLVQLADWDAWVFARPLATLAAFSGLGESTVRRRIRALESEGILEPVRKSRGGGASAYQIRVDRLKERRREDFNPTAPVGSDDDNPTAPVGSDHTNPPAAVGLDDANPPAPVGLPDGERDSNPPGAVGYPPAPVGNPPGAVANQEYLRKKNCARAPLRLHRVEPAGRRSPDVASPAESVLAAYPRAVDRDAGLTAVTAAIEREASRRGGVAAAAEYLLERARAYAASPAGQDPPPGDTDFRKTPERWFSSGAYANPDTEWARPNGTPGAVAAHAAGASADRARDLTAQQNHRRRLQAQADRERAERERQAEAEQLAGMAPEAIEAAAVAYAAGVGDVVKQQLRRALQRIKNNDEGGWATVRKLAALGLERST